MLVRSVDDLGVLARDRRKALRLSQADLAARAGVTRQWMVRFERGSADVSLAKALAVLRALGLEVRIAPAGAGSQRSGNPIRIPRVDVPRIDLSQADWAEINRRLAERNLDLTAALDEIRSKYGHLGRRAADEASAGD